MGSVEVAGATAETCGLTALWCPGPSPEVAHGGRGAGPGVLSEGPTGAAVNTAGRGGCRSPQRLLGGVLCWQIPCKYII